MIFLIVYSYVWPIGVPIAANMAGMIELLFTTPAEGNLMSKRGRTNIKQIPFLSTTERMCGQCSCSFPKKGSNK